MGATSPAPEAAPMTLHLTIDLRAVLVGFVLLLVAAGIATPFAISLADNGPSGDRVSEQRRINLHVTVITV